MADTASRAQPPPGGHGHVDNKEQTGKLDVSVEEAAVEPPLKVCRRRTRMRSVGDRGGPDNP